VAELELDAIHEATHGSNWCYPTKSYAGLTMPMSSCAVQGNPASAEGEQGGV